VRITDDDVRAAAIAAVNEGLRRRYRFSQIICGVKLERYRGVLDVLVTDSAATDPGGRGGGGGELA
jgi:hypothetical protein